MTIINSLIDANQAQGGDAGGGGMFNAAGATFVVQPPNIHSKTPTSIFSANQAIGGTGGDGGAGGSGAGGFGGPAGRLGKGGNAGSSQGGLGADAGGGGYAKGGGLINAGTVPLTGITIDSRANKAGGGAGGRGGAGGFSSGGNGGAATSGAGAGGNGVAGGFGLGGGIFNFLEATLAIAPRLGAKKGSRQSAATDTITANQAARGSGAPGGSGGNASAGAAGEIGGTAASAVFPGASGADGTPGNGVGGGLFRYRSNKVTIEDTNITGNSASTADNDSFDPVEE
jgi:hypothetical protein